MIKSFRHKGLKRAFEEDEWRWVPPDQVKKIRDILLSLDEAEDIDNMRLRELRLHKLTGNLKGFRSVRVSGNWRIIFRFEDGHAYDVELIDYH